MQRPWGRTGPEVLEEQQGGVCGQNKESKAKRGRRAGHGGDGAGRVGP